MKCPLCGHVSDRNIRSDNQNRYMHGVVFAMIADEMGEYDLDHVKDLMKHKFLTETTVTKTKSGLIIEEKKTRHTSELDTKEMEDFLERVRFWAKDFLKITIPLPNQESYAITT